MYKQLTLEKRYMLYALKQEGCSKRKIAGHLGVHVSTVYREISRNLRGRDCVLLPVFSSSVTLCLFSLFVRLRKSVAGLVGVEKPIGYGDYE